MFRAKAVFSGFSVDDLTKAKAFYQETLGLNVDRDGVGLGLHLPGGGTVFAYPKTDHQPASFTILNFEVDDIDVAVDELTRRGVRFELRRWPTNRRQRHPAGNTLSVIE